MSRPVSRSTLQAGWKFRFGRSFGYSGRALRKEFTANLGSAQSWLDVRMFQSAHKLSSQILLASDDTREDLIRAELSETPRLNVSIC